MIRIAALIASIFLLSNAQGAERSITLSSTTSTRDSGLFETAAQQTRSAPSPLVAPCGGGLGRGVVVAWNVPSTVTPAPNPSPQGTHKGEGSTPVRSIKPRQIHRHAL
jgi:hypothetical protein